MKRTSDEIMGTYLRDVAQTFLVQCPSCASCALVRPTTNDRLTLARLSCLHCGVAKEWRAARAGVVTRGHNQQRFASRAVSIGAPVDWYFHMPLWLQSPCVGHILWAYNSEHLAWLKSYIGAELRGSTRNVESGSWANAALASRLPHWMKLAKHRETVLRAIADLELKLP